MPAKPKKQPNIKRLYVTPRELKAMIAFAAGHITIKDLKRKLKECRR